jgi:hypothetical protein
MPETLEPHCPYVSICPVYKIWRFLGGRSLSLWDVVKRLDEDRAKQLAKRLEWQEPQRSTIDALTKENAALRSYKRRAELFPTLEGPQPYLTIRARRT